MKYSLKDLIASMWEHRKNKNFGRKGLEWSYRGLYVKASIGMTGQISKIPWISYCAEGQETNNGIYPVILFYGTPEFAKYNKGNKAKKIVLAYGISATNVPSKGWGAAVENKQTIKEAFEDWGYKTTDSGNRKYNSSYVYMVYDWTEDIIFEQIQRDLDELIDTYERVLSEGNEVISPSQTVKKEPKHKESDILITSKLSDLAASANATLPDTLLDAIKKITPKSFEVLIAKLLNKMGYGNTIEDVIVTQYVGDNGIDGYVRKDRLDIEKICAYQAKRYTSNNVGIEEMNALGGAMINCGTTCGIFVTTSDFTSKAKDYNPRGYTIKRINGKTLVDYLIEYGIGVKTEIIEVKTVDTVFLNSLCE